MEREGHYEDNLPSDEAARVAEYQRLVNEGIDRARQAQRPIDHLTAKRIAQELSPGSGPLYELAETGAIAETIEFDLALAEEVAQDLEIEDLHSPWIAALREYLDGRLIRSELPGWNDPSTG
jgi:hypothetical protein